MRNFSLCIVIALIASLFVPYRAEAAPAYVNSNVANGSASSLAPTLNGVTTGNLIVVGIVTGVSGTTVNSVSDGTNSYARRTNRNFKAGAGGIEIWEAHNVTGGNLTITASFSASVSASVIVAEYSGLDTSAPFDQKADTANGSSTAPDSGNATTTQASELLIGVGGFGVGTYTAGSTGGGSFTYTVRQTGSFQFILQDTVVNATGTYTSNGTMGTSGAWTHSIATFKAAAAGGGTAPATRVIIIN